MCFKIAASNIRKLTLNIFGKPLKGTDHTSQPLALGSFISPSVAFFACDLDELKTKSMVGGETNVIQTTEFGKRQNKENCESTHLQIRSFRGITILYSRHIT